LALKLSQAEHFEVGVEAPSAAHGGGGGAWAGEFATIQELAEAVGLPCSCQPSRLTWSVSRRWPP
jgi:hypothetical protein